MKAYLRRMSKKREWADHVVVLGMSAVLKCNIIIITSSPNTHPDDNIIWINCGNASADLILLGHIWENHYQSLRPFYLKPKTDNCFQEYIRSRFCKSVGSDVKCIIKCVSNDEDTDDIITAHLLNLDDMLIGRFNHRNKNKDTLQYRCDRCRRPRGKNKGSLPTVANGCSAYVSFRFVQHMSKKAVIIRQKVQHTEHDLKNLQEKHLSKPDPVLCQYIDALLEQNKKPMQILCMAWKWARDHGKTDVHDRRYFVSPQDIKYFSQQYKMKHRCHPNDSLAVNHLCTQTLKDEIVLYQELIEKDYTMLIFNKDELPTPAVTQYLKSNWFSDIWSCRWNNFGRKFYHEDHDTNNIVERFFLSIK
ncbi:unnamed protein product [Mytilus coruscus]|uniref:OTU domain-containing protein n=1 Tax=Mytilus coruscus TaxID=42192 RepID=A0A6J8ARY2_MYTCO|nr:unnamed protein product [Mytilus coruscus]